MKCFVLMFLFLLTTKLLLAQSMTTMGTDFWVCFLSNENTYSTYSDATHIIFVSSPNNCSVTIENPLSGWSQVSQVVANSVTTITIPTNHSWNTSSETVMNKGFHISSTDSVSVYVSTSGVNTYDVTNSIPTASLRDEYMILSYPSDRWGSEFAVVSTVDSTWVDVYLASATRNGVPSGDTLSFMMPVAGQVYQVITPQVGDFTGSYVKSRDCKPIAVFQGDVCLYVPQWSNGMTCDHAFEQAIPTAYWGREFVVPHFSTTHSDYVRVTSLYDSCIIYRNGQYSTTLNSGETYNFQVPISGTPNVVTASLPVSVNVFFASVGGSGTGDPSMLTVIPMEQKVHNITFATYNTQYTSNHKVNIVLKTSDVSLFQLDGVSHTSDFLAVPSDGTYSYAKLSVSSGVHTMNMSASGEGFLAYAFGMGSHESYAYSVGSRLKSLENTLFVDGRAVIIDDTIDVCIGASMTFSIFHRAELGNIFWDIDGANYTGDTVVHTFTTTGFRNVRAYLSSNTSSCFTEDDTLGVVLNIHGSDTINIDTVVCQNPFVWYGDSVTTAGTYSHLLENQQGCDSLLRLNVDFETIPTTDIDTQVCNNPFNWYENSITEPGQYTHTIVTQQGCDSILRINVDFMAIPSTDVYYEGCDSIDVNGVVYRDDTRIADTVQTAEGCDSIVNVIYTIYPSYKRNVQLDLDEGDTVYWIDGGRYWSNEQHPNVVYRTVHGCDSIITLQLNIIPHAAPPPQDSSAIWIPSAFTPDEETNSLFKIESNDMVEMHVTIFTRWGLYVTEFDGLTGGWDGTYKGEKCKQETYVYLVEYRTKAMPLIFQKRLGTVTLLR